MNIYNVSLIRLNCTLGVYWTPARLLADSEKATKDVDRPVYTVRQEWTERSHRTHILVYCIT